ncbi:MAG: 50S ribosomal protein L17 [Deltaproteobacteria bacterium]|nr:50S ribosomal protein L17 [Deltaproteobacteria bacterium]
MRHLRAGKTLGVKPAHRRARLRNLVTSLLEHGKIRTTVLRAKEMRTPLDQMITLGKQGDLSARRKALTFVKSKLAMANLFGELAERYKDRQGGYSRIMRMDRRRGDGAEMALVMLVGSETDPFIEGAKTKRAPGGRKPKGKVIDEVSEKVKGAEDAEITEVEKPKAKAPKAGKAKAGEDTQSGKAKK